MIRIGCGTLPLGSPGAHGRRGGSSQEVTLDQIEVSCPELVASLPHRFIRPNRSVRVNLALGWAVLSPTRPPYCLRLLRT